MRIAPLPPLLLVALFAVPSSRALVPNAFLLPKAFLLPVRRCFGLSPPHPQPRRTQTVMASSPGPSTTLKDMLGSKVDCPQLGIGMAALGRPGYISLTHASDFEGVGKSVEAMRERAYAVLDAAHAAGVRYYDAARSYGRAEEFLAGWLKERGITPGDVCVGSKWGYTYTAGWQTDTGGQPHEVKEHSRENLERQVAETEGLLGPYVNLYQIHSATQASGVLTNQSVIEGLWGVKKGKGWRIGLSLSGVEQAETLRMAIGVKDAGGERLFDSVQATYNVLESSCGEALEEARKAGMQVIVKEGVANGRLFEEGNGGPSRGRLRALHEEAARLGCGPDALGLACIMVQEFAPMVLSGAACSEHLESNAEALRLVGEGRVTGEVARRVIEGCRMDPAEYWAERTALSWQ